MRNITAIPTEIWDPILTAAYSDGAYTGRSLALTNKFFYSQSLSNRLSCIRSTSLTRIEAFLSFLDAQPSECKSRIYHLFLSFHSEAMDICTLSTDHFIDVSKSQQTYINEASTQWIERFVRSMTTLFSIAAPTLCTLCVTAGSLSRIAPLPVFPYGPLPVLEELSVHHALDLFLPASYASHGIWNSDFSSSLPALRRIHVVNNHPDIRGADVFARLNHYSLPNLTHVRVSALGGFARDFLGSLGRALGIPHVPYWRRRLAARSPLATASHPLDSQSAPLLPNVNHVIVHGSLPLYLGPCGAGDFDWLDFCNEVEQTARLAKENRNVIVLPLTRPRRRNWRWPERLFDGWVSRIEGGIGFWVESEDEEAKLEVYEDDPAPSPREMVALPLPDEDDDL